MNPGDVHDGHPLGGPSRHWFTVYLDANVMAEHAGRSDIAFTRAAFVDAPVRSAIASLLTRMQEGDALSFDEALTDACAAMLHGHSTLRPAREGGDCDLSRVIERLGDAPSHAPTLDELARIAGLGKFQLLRRFRKRFGVTPHDWLVQRRADRARALIRTGTSLVEAAAASGFADQSHMTRAFVQRFGFTPGAWQAGAISFKTRD